MSDKAEELKPEETVSFAELTLRGRLAELETALMLKDPGMKNHLAAVHKQLHEQDDLVHLLTDEQRAVIVAGYKSYRNIQLVEKAKAPASRGRSAKVTEDDI